jgi:hypothetical protein
LMNRIRDEIRRAQRRTAPGPLDTGHPSPSRRRSRKRSAARRSSATSPRCNA